MAKKKASPPQSPAASKGEPPPAAYVVLARKYRPTRFQELVGQEAMVTTLRNAFASDRIAQGYMLTGVRGVGKTTTARILSRALNYEAPGIGKPTFDMPEFGRHCAEIMEGRHPDVLEMDAASNTGVDNVREIIESARYKPLMARYKVYLIDEVHMLSKGAFNALLKTLEEPPGHVKFIFATTEVRKVPVTVLSRTQRFDLRRVDVPVLIEHFKKIVAAEGAVAEAAALSLIARACEGSVRDGLSLLDQALAMGSGQIESAGVRAMLGLADRGRVFDLIELVLANRAGEAIQALGALTRDGAEPGQVLADLAEAVHIATRAKTLGGDAAGEGLSAEERRRAGALAERLSIPILARAWQMLLKGLEEVAAAPNPAAAAEMVLIRLAFTADLPAPDEVLKALGGESRTRRQPAPAAAPARQPALEGKLAHEPDAEEAESDEHEPETDGLEAAAPARPLLRSFVDVVALAGKRREAKLKVHLEEHVSLVKFDAAGSLELHLLPGAPKELANELREKLNAWTGRRWMVALSKSAGEPALGEVERTRAAAEIEAMRQHPAVAAVLKQFPDAEISSVRPIAPIDTDETGTG
jgi:DNA polymerase-3 subunit gamma/tau